MLYRSKLTPSHLARKALVYVRQSTSSQVLNHLESQDLQYSLEARAAKMGFQSIEVIDCDLGSSANGLVQRDGLDYVLQQLVLNQVGAVFCWKVCRVARNGREWETFLELAGYTHTLLIDTKTVYDPQNSDDRLLLGLQGSFAEYESSVFRQRAHEAIQNKAKRGELRVRLALGLCWNAQNQIVLNPDRQIQEVLFHVFDKFRELRSARQVFLWFVDDKISFPRRRFTSTGVELSWTTPTYGCILHVLKNPFYAGAYAYGMSSKKVVIEDGKVRKKKESRKPPEEWKVLLTEHHPGYISWQEYESNQLQLSANRPMRDGSPGPSKGGQSLLSGILRCRRCGQKLHVNYSGRSGYLRYRCQGNSAKKKCQSVNGKLLEKIVLQELLKVVQPLAVEAAFEASNQTHQDREKVRNLLDLELERARYEAQLASKRYKQVDPDNRLVASSLERDWNDALVKQDQLEKRLEELSCQPIEQGVQLEELLEIASDMKGVWEHESTEIKTKQHIVRILIEELIVDQQEDELVLVFHWSGGQHSEVRKNRRVEGTRTPKATIEHVRNMIGTPDKEIASTLNEMGLQTARGLSWNTRRVRRLRKTYGLASSATSEREETLHLTGAAEYLSLPESTVRQLLREGVLEGEQRVARGAWKIPMTCLESDEVKRYVQNMKDKGSK